MANQEHLDILKQGVGMWNQWRKEHPEIKPDLSHVFFIRANLKGANLSETILHRATFTDEAPLGADFLEGDGLVTSELYQADFSYTDLRNAYFIQTNLDKVNLGRAKIVNTIFRGIDLSQFKRLDTVEHLGPSSIDINAIYQSGGNIPEIFLRGAGVPESFIIYARSLVLQPIEYYACFISFSNKDLAFAERLYADLHSKGVRCWFAPKDLKIGDKIRPSIDEAIRVHDKLLLVLSEHSVESAWVEKEVETTFEKERQQNKLVLFPIRLDDTVMATTQAWAADIRRTRHIGDFRQWKHHDVYQKALDRLLRDLKAEVPSTGA